MRRHLRLVVGILVLVVVPRVAAGQVPHGPRVEIGLQGALQNATYEPRSFGPRLTFNLSPLTALEATADFRPDGDVRGRHESRRSYSLQLKRSLAQLGRVQVFGSVGGSAGSIAGTFPAYSYQGRNGVIEHPAFAYRYDSRAALVGLGMQYEASPYVAFRGEVQAIIGDDGGVRAMAGASVPVGRFRARSRPSAGGFRPAGALSQVKPGQIVWIRARNGQEITGEVAALSTGSIQVRRQTGIVTIALSEIEQIDGPDKLKNGAAIGGLVGAVGVGVLAVAYACDEGCGGAGAIALTVGAFGAGLGAVVGAVVDSLIPGRRLLYSSPGAPGAASTVVTPLVTRGGGGVGVAITWR